MFVEIPVFHRTMELSLVLEDYSWMSDLPLSPFQVRDELIRGEQKREKWERQ